MKKADADDLKKKYDPIGACQLALEYMSPQELHKQLNFLDVLEVALEHEFSSYALDGCHDLVDEEERCIVRICWFSKGMSDYFIGVSGQGAVVAYDGDIPSFLLGGCIKLINTVHQENNE